MSEVLIKSILDEKHVKTLKVMSIFYTILVFPLGIMMIIKGGSLGNQKIEVTQDNIKLTYKKSSKKSAVIPIEKISGAEYFEKYNGINIYTASEQIRFENILNAKEIVDVINDLIDKRKTNSATTVVNTSDNADQLVKYKQLLESGVISQEEFDAKKKQLLGL